MAHAITYKPALTFTDIIIAETLLSMYGDIEIAPVESLKFLRVYDLCLKLENKLAPFSLSIMYAAIHNLSERGLVEMKSEPYSSLTHETLNYIKVTELGQCEIPMLMNDYFDIMRMDNPLDREAKPYSWRGLIIAAVVGGLLGTLSAWLTTLAW